MNFNKAPEHATERLLAEHGITSPPVDPAALAKAQGIVVVRRRFEDADVSEILFRDGDHHVIGVNSAHPPVRQRFTVAHELSHRTLHPVHELILDVPVRSTCATRPQAWPATWKKSKPTPSSPAC
jgi:Zn-dependent peptidase ImmA (M78 family)